ncbi:hypothetical protein P5V15_004559 [Pogonomyrmex californicus]
MLVLNPSRPPLLPVTLLVAVLTLSVSAAADGTSSVPSVPGHDAPITSSSPTVEIPDATDDRKELYTNVAEGGPISVSSSTTQHGSNKETVETEFKSESKSRENVPKERNASSSIVARKGVEEKIKARKGVQENVKLDQSMDLEKENAFNQSIFENMKSIMENNPALETDHVKSETSNINTPKLNITNPRLDDSSNRGINSNYSNTSISVNVTSHLKIITNTTVKTSHTEKHIPKPKPTVTAVDGPEINEPIPSSRTKNPSLGMPRKIDYIVPVIITIVALPILGAAIFILYRHGRDCWDKRHYRRMDFLIDGMYND